MITREEYNKALDIVEAKTMCCKAKWYRKSRANFRCEKCEKDVTLEIMFLYQALIE